MYFVMFTIKKPHFKSNWADGIKNSSKLAIYSQFKCYLIPESYSEIINIRKYLIAFSKFVTKHLPPYDETQNGFQLFIHLMKTSDTDEIRDVACFIYHAMNMRKRLIANLR